jgi:glycosyltransferase involved in cell wall biosynthesis
MTTAPRRLRVLLVIPSLAQAGAERYLYEYTRALDPARYEIEVLTSVGAGEADYYFRQLRTLGIPVHTQLHGPRLSRLTALIPERRRLRPLRQAVVKAGAALGDAERKVRLRGLLARFDLISCLQIEAYDLLQSALPDNDRVLIHLMSHQFQYDRPAYAAALPGRRYRCLYFDPNQVGELRGSAMEGAETAFVPLALDLSGRERIYAPSATGRKRIAIYSRIDPSRRLEPLMYAFQGLARRVDAELWLYGRGDTVALNKLLDMLRIRDRVVLPGHQEDLEASLRRDQPHLVWMASVGAAMGYASLEVGSFGFPIVFYSFGAEDEASVRARTGGAVNAFASVPELVDFSVTALADPPGLVALGARLRDHIFELNDVRTSVRLLEAQYERVVAGQ